MDQKSCLGFDSGAGKEAGAGPYRGTRVPVWALHGCFRKRAGTSRFAQWARGPNGSMLGRYSGKRFGRR